MKLLAQTTTKKQVHPQTFDKLATLLDWHLGKPSLDQSQLHQGVHDRYTTSLSLSLFRKHLNDSS